MDEQQMQFADPDWQPSEHTKQGVINLNPHERPSSFAPVPEEYSQEIPYHERGKLEPQPRSKSKVWFIVIPALLLILCLALVGALILPFGSHTSTTASVPVQIKPGQPSVASLIETQVLPVHDYKPTSSADNEPIVVISDDIGSVHVHIGGPGNSVTVTATEHDNKANFKGMTVTTSEGGPNNNTLTITANSDTGVSNSRSIDLDITVPNGSSIQLTEGSGAVRIDGISSESAGGNAQVKITSGSVEISGVEGGIDVQSQNAPVALHDLGGTISATTVNSSIAALRLSGIVTLNSSTGSIMANDVQFGGSFSTGGNGSITLSNSILGQQTLLKTDSGTINFQGTIQPGANVQFESGSGAITITLPASTTFQLDFGSISGKLRNDFGSNNVGSGRPANLQITTDSGPAFIKKQ